MFLLYNQVTQSIANNLAGYNAGAWNFFYNEVANELSSLITYLKEGEKNVSLLNNNLTYIQNSINNVNGVGNIEDRAHFTYYDPVNGAYDGRVGPAILADPNNDTRENVADAFNPSLNDGMADITLNGVPIHKIYDEESSIAGGLVKVDGFADYMPLKDEDASDKFTLLSKTNEWFKNAENDYISQRFKTIHSRFHTVNNVEEELRSDIGNSSYSKTYGLSHGRNLLKEEPDTSYGYDNPYCRVWTYHHQYHRIVSDTMRPFRNDSGEPATMQDLNRENGWSRFRAPADGGFEDGGTRLGKYGAMYDNAGKTNGFVNITPSWDVLNSDSFSDKPNVDLRHCMFSIENLAWKGVFSDYDDGLEYYGLSREQKGPLGGRIMWFPPYDLTFNENSSARWEENNFIGRGEPMYTYSNTSRSGTLSFKLLIDHPSILDYWGRKNKVGNPYESSVDDIDSKEQELLRFFAGCSRLSTKKVKPIEDVPEETPEPDPQPEEPKPEPPSNTNDNLIQFFVFYPNNYSGMDDKVGGEVDPIEYLLNGLGTQRKYVANGSQDIQDFGVDMTQINNWGGKQVGGYEMRDSGVSLVKDLTTTNAITALEYNIDEERKEAQIYDTDKLIQSIITRCETGEDKDCASDLGFDYANSTNPSIRSSFDNTFIKNSSGGTIYFDGENSILVNCVSEEEVVKFKKSIDAIGLIDVVCVRPTYTDLFYFISRDDANKAVEPNRGKNFLGESHIIKTKGLTLMKMYDKDKVKPGSTCPTDKKTAKEWHKNRYYYRADKNTLNQVLIGEEDSYIDKTSYKLNSTGYQSAVSHFGLKDKDKTFSLAEIYVAIKGDDNNVLANLYNNDHVSLIKSVLNGEKGEITKVICKGMASSQSNSDRSDNNQSGLAKHRATTIQNWLKKNLKVGNIEYSQEEFKVSTEKTNSKWDVNEKTAKLTRMAFVEIHYNGEGTEDASESQIGVDENGSIENGSTTITNETKGSTEDTSKTTTDLNEVTVRSRYDDEARFFKKLQENDPFITKLLSERIKYFNPTFHSMSPEGFNARLTFLNQCLRQGPTISGADTNNTNANNLSFGRPPVCVLRIGDFYNTKIIITSLSIDYDPLLWDLNQEGIGVMPMIANVSLSFNFIGGSDLGGPIQRLQNALSFNYYANASVYDNRAENIEYEQDTLGTVKAFKPFNSQFF